MSAGRPPKGSKHVERLEGGDAEKQRLRIVLETLSGERSVEQACEELGVSAWSVQTAATATERTKAARHLFELTKDGWSERLDDETMMTFASLLDGACDPVRYWVARCLWSFGVRARPTAPKLEQLLAEVDRLEGDKTSAWGIRFALSQMGIDVSEADLLSTIHSL